MLRGKMIAPASSFLGGLWAVRGTGTVGLIPACMACIGEAALARGGIAAAFL
jgi:hypothetical protein